ncbi:aspartate aminotransferase family protein [Gloeocapsopsis crepidinum LEGE 06123]|uniref:Aspartate aminotransferase family protein n=1 Tax=Gloeocapsopsis crepidinum LEGE 06123 TaxID=588587 RepID=A0ABR9UPU4_9CHRO|nr:aspartate aminotransferase family protein [Gloeocapsopsis crepidinum]MBE9190296.1 aspartate aminotransferase family protein [Gloeocapsopsis crepidinum LEGE 06123]
MPTSSLLTNNTNLTNHQQQYLEKFIARYNQKTQKSKQQTQKYRPVLADVRGSAGFRAEYKEIVYPIIGKYAVGSKMWDIDENEYVDLMMGFGVNLFGYNPPFLKEAITQRLEQGIHFGPQSDLAGEVAELFSKLTGMERVAISNTGTEAVMTALRLARAATGRHKIVMFSGSYHGHFDGTLAKSQIVDGIATVMPTDIGIPHNIIADVSVLEYGNFQALEVIKANADDLAAVIIEPIQNSRPDLQPREFLQELRQLTAEFGIALIFDEMLTGFRIHPNGAQGWFGIQADIATYGKIVGGGMPIGIIAGKATYLDRIDGGMWNYGDTSSPQVETTFFAGTYCKHPLAMAAALAVLKHLKKEGASLYQNLNDRTTQFINQLNTYFAQDEVPIRLANCGSIFNAVPLDDSVASDNAADANLGLIYYHLIEKGVFLRPGGGLLSTAHSDEDINYIIEAVKESVQNLREGHFLP